MGLIPQTKCSRCDRKYSGLRSRCPYCGARRRKKGKRVSDTDNSTWKLIIGILLVVVLIAAVVVILVTSLNGADEQENPDDEQENIVPDGNEGVSTLPGNDVTDPDGEEPGGEDDTDEPPVETTPSVQTVAIYTAYGSQTTDFTMSIGGSEQLSCVYTPEEVEATPVWESSYENVFIVTPSGKVTGIGRGDATLTVTVDGVSTECIVRVR